MSNAENVVDLSRNLYGVLEIYVDKMPRDRKFTIGDRLLTLGLNVIGHVVRAYYSPREKKKEHIQAANIDLEIIRQLLRHLFETNSHNAAKHEHFSETMHALGVALGSWAKSL